MKSMRTDKEALNSCTTAMYFVTQFIMEMLSKQYHNWKCEKGTTINYNAKMCMHANLQTLNLLTGFRS